MDSKIVAQALLTAPRELLAAQLAFLDEATVAKLLKSKAADLFSEDKGEFNRILEKAARSLVAEPPGELVLRILGKLNTTLALPARKYVAVRDFEDNCEEILSRCLSVLRETERDFSGTDLQDMLRFLMNKMFGEIGRRFESLSTEKQQEIVGEVRKFIDDLPDAQREKLRKEIGADQITDGYIRKAIISGALSTAFAAAVSVSGFAFYTGAVSLLAMLAGLVGLTLPFSVYMGLTSAIAVVSNPVFFISALAGGGLWLYNRQNHKMQRRLAPLVVTQLVLANLAGNPNGSDHSDEAIQLWQSAWTAVEQARAALRLAEGALAATREELRRTKNRIHGLNDQQAQVKKDLDGIHSEMKAQCVSSAADIARSTWGARLSEDGERLKGCLDRMDTCRQRGVRAGFSGILGRVKRTADTCDAQQKADLAANAIASTVLAWGVGYGIAYPEEVKRSVARYTSCQASREALEAELAEAQQKKMALDRQAAAEEQHGWRCHSECQRAEQRYWGLSEIR